MSARDLGEGIELPLRGNRVTGVATEDGPQRFPRRRTTLVDLGRKLETSSGPAAATTTATTLLALYTLARVAANILAVGWAASYFAMLDAVLRPVMTGCGVYFFLCKNDRFSEKSLLHLWCRRTIFALAFFMGDDSFLALVSWALEGTGKVAAVCMGGTLLWEVGCNFMQVHMTNLKLQALRQSFTAKLCHVVGVIGLFSIVLFGAAGQTYQATSDMIYLNMARVALALSLFCCSVTLLVQCCNLCLVACRALWAAAGDKAIRFTACLLIGNAVLVLLGPALSFWSFYTYADREAKITNATWLTLDLFFQICNTLTLSGMVGPRQWNRPMDAFRELADLSGFGFASKRIAFPGHIHDKATKCVVSFPGKYSELWDKAVSAVTSQAGNTGTESWSLACVFLTDAASGLGQHAKNPDTPGKCWCHSIYGQVPAETYLNVVEVDPDHIDSPNNRQMLAFKRSDSAAMGQQLVIKSDQSDIEWQRELAEATEKAQQLCFAKDGRAPWGCQWFEEWKRNVDAAAKLGQELHVFYFEGRMGQGKVPWHQLCDEAAKTKARESGGLGASQTAEVAYLERMGLSFFEHDVRDFQAIIAAVA